MFIYACTIFLSAVLLFQVQPVIAKAILPRFGGSAAVWTACMLFFQLVLLAGYGYAHWVTSRVRLRWQVILHASLLGASLLLLPIHPDPRWHATEGGQPVFQILALLGTSVGIPYLLLSTTSPLLQAWFAGTHSAALPYRLFSVSNAASLLGLLAYPFVIEPHISTHQQLQFWSAIYAAFAVLIMVTGAYTWRRRPVATAAPDREDQEPDVKVGAARITLWVALPACASALMLAVTNHLTQDVAPIPFLWILPLSCYLVSFVFCFGAHTWRGTTIFRWALIPSVSLLGIVVAYAPSWPLKVVIPVAVGALFVCCMFCHGELAGMKPGPRRLTAFYLAMSVGGAMGGVFVGIAAPLLYVTYAELPVAAVACAFLGIAAWYGNSAAHLKIAAAATALFAIMLAVQPRITAQQDIARNFYGTLRVNEVRRDAGRLRQLQHGSTHHGSQFLSDALAGEPTAYFGRGSGVGLVLGHASASPRRVGVIGLGIGTLAAYAKPHDLFRFYELNPQVQLMAEKHFRFLKKCPGRYEVVLGDARLSMEQEPNQNYDVLVLDAFSGDSIPVHLLTTDAFRMYSRHLRPTGILAVHITNRYLNLAPVVASVCEPLGYHVRLVDSPAKEPGTLYAKWALITRDRRVFDSPVLSAGVAIKQRIRPWTDDYSNLFDVLVR